VLEAQLQSLEKPPLAVRVDEFLLIPDDGDPGSKYKRVASIETPLYPVKKAPIPRRILVVEDNLDAVHSLVSLLRDMGHQVDYAINGYVAIELARRMHPEFVFLDLGLPGVSGFDVCRWVKTDPALQAARVIAITAYAQEEFRTRSKAAGCELHLIKPVTAEVFEQILAS
jgi:CheY-like chemotaxis protein